MQQEEVIIIGGGPCGMSAAIELKNKGIDPLIIEKGNVANTISRYPTHQTFFSSSDKLEVGGVPFITENHKPVRNQAMVYYRDVARRMDLRMNTYEEAVTLSKDGEVFTIKTVDMHEREKSYTAKYIIIATGYYDQPNYLGIPGEQKEKVMHYFKEAHPYFRKETAVIGGKNSAVDAALELHKAGANVTVLYRGSAYSESIKPWILPEFASFVKKGEIKMLFEAEVTEIGNDALTYNWKGTTDSMPNDFVFAMTGYRPDYGLFEQLGVRIDTRNGQPVFNEETLETNVSNAYVAGVVASGHDNNKIFIENGRFHGERIARSICGIQS